MRKSKTTTNTSRIWGGRFAETPDEVMTQINASIDIDRRLYRHDIAGSKAHARMLGRQGIISTAEADKIIGGLDSVLKEMELGAFVFKTEYEDIHMNVEARLRELIGDTAGKLHTARSRNDQVATSFRLWMRDAIDTACGKIDALTDTLEGLIAVHENTVMPGFTHLQVAQPVTLAKHLDAYVSMLTRDKGRLADARARMNKSPLGAAALAGTPFPIDRNFTAAELGFDRPVNNTMDAVSARDFANEFLFAAAQCGLHLSRLAEEIILWSTPQFNFVRLSDAWSTGSSIMPQKKNPDAAELVRGKTGRLTGNLVGLMTVMKGLPLAYNKDMQEDKEPVFDSFDTLCLCLDAMTGMLSTATWNGESMRRAAETGFATATRIADWLVMNCGIPFRDAHHITGRIVKMAEERGCTLDALPLADMQQAEPRINETIYDILKV